MTYAQLRNGVRAHIGQEHRYTHVVRVARLAETLARVHGESTQRARLAGMLHDLARLYAPARLLEECERRALFIGAFERANPIVLHAPLGAELARELFGVTDPAVLSAIRKHTLADATMSRLDAIIYLADALEPGREFSERKQLQDLAMLDLDEAMRATLASTIAFLHARGLRLAPQTFAAMQAYTREDVLCKKT
jgi:predicted HD superfamily hydrolase involved in NAD metabolism